MQAERLAAACLRKLPWIRFTPEVAGTAQMLRDSALAGRQIPLLSETHTNLDQTRAYELSAAGCALAKRYNLIPLGRKIGFTNTKIWSKYNVSEPNWGYLWYRRFTTMTKANNKILLPSKLMNLQPRIEPEIVFCLNQIPHSHMTEREAISCVAWIAHGFEIVVSLFKDWKFTAADTTATNALHQCLFIGEKRVIEEKDLDTLPAQLESFEIKLHREGEVVDIGRGSNVLGSPIKALLHLCRMLENQDLHPRLHIGEIITTGTLTKAMPIDLHQTWSTSIEGIDLSPMSMQTIPLPVDPARVRVAYRPGVRVRKTASKVRHIKGGAKA